MICHALTFGISRCGRKGTEGVGANYRLRLMELNSIAWDRFHVAQMSLSYEFYSFPRLRDLQTDIVKLESRID